MTTHWKRLPALLLATGSALLLWAYLHLLDMPEQTARIWLVKWSGHFLAWTSVVILVTLLLHLDAFNRLRHAMPRSLVRTLPVILLGAALSTALLAPQTHRIYYDETIYLSIGQNLAHLNRAQTCNAGGQEYGQFHCDQWEYNKQPNGFPFMTSVAFRLFGISETTIFLLNNLLLGCAALTVLLLAHLVQGGWRAGLFAALITILIPHNLHWYNTTAAEPGAAVSAACAILIALYYRRTQNPVTLTLLVAWTALAIQFRVESLLLLPLLFILIIQPAWKRSIPVLLANLLLFGLLTLPLGLHTTLVHNHPWGSSGTPFSWEHLLPNLHTNGWYYLTNQEFPLPFTLLALLGVAWPASQWLMKRGIFALWFLLFWGVFLFFYAGSYHYGADVRFALLSFLPLALLAGLGAENLLQWLTRWTPVRTTLLTSILTALLLISLLPFLPFVRAETNEAWAARADIRFAKKMITHLPDESMVLTQNPNLFHLWGVPAAQLSLTTNDPIYVNQVLFPRHRGGIYFHYNFWCNVPDPIQNRFCENILEQYDHELLTEHQEKNFRYALYRLILKK